MKAKVKAGVMQFPAREHREEPGGILESAEGHGPASIFSLALQLPALRERIFVSEAPTFAVTCCANIRTQKHRDGREGQAGLQIENKVLIRLELKC